jgi:hypothetical protein
MEIKLKDSGKKTIITIDDIIGLSISPDIITRPNRLDIWIKAKNNKIYKLFTDKENQNKINKLLNKEKFYISNDFSVDVTEIKDFRKFDSYAYGKEVLLGFNSSPFLMSVDAKHKIMIETFKKTRKINNF